MTVPEEDRAEVMRLVQAAVGAIPVAGPMIAGLVPLVPLVVELMQREDQALADRPGPEKKARVLAPVRAIAEAFGVDGDRAAQHADEIIERRIRQRKVAAAMGKWLGAAVDLDDGADDWIQVPGITLPARDVVAARELLKELEG